MLTNMPYILSMRFGSKTLQTFCLWDVGNCVFPVSLQQFLLYLLWPTTFMGYIVLPPCGLENDSVGFFTFFSQLCELAQNWDVIFGKGTAILSHAHQFWGCYGLLILCDVFGT